jgi:glutaredoxin
VRLFIKPYCGWCHKAMRWLNERGAAYTTLDVTTDPVARAELVKLSGSEVVPVIDVDGQILADFGPDELAPFWDNIEKASSGN